MRWALAETPASMWLLGRHFSQLCTIPKVHLQSRNAFKRLHGYAIEREVTLLYPRYACWQA